MSEGRCHSEVHERTILDPIGSTQGAGTTDTGEPERRLVSDLSPVTDVRRTGKFNWREPENMDGVYQ